MKINNYIALAASVLLLTCGGGKKVSSYREAEEIIKRSNKRQSVLLVTATAYCPPCRDLERYIEKNRFDNCSNGIDIIDMDGGGVFSGNEHEVQEITRALKDYGFNDDKNTIPTVFVRKKVGDDTVVVSYNGFSKGKIGGVDARQVFNCPIE